jgi:formate dehydrogenase subunit delta
MSHNPVDKLVKMANQIGDFFVAQRAHEPVAGVTEHLKKFWDPSMRKKIIEHVAHGGKGLDPIVLEAVKRLDAGGADGSGV